MVKIKQVKGSFYQNFGFVSFLGDLILLNLLLFAAFKIRYESIQLDQLREVRILFMLLNLSWFALMYYGRVYIYNRVERIDRIIGKNLKFVLFETMLGFSLIEIVHLEYVSRLVPVYFFLLFGLAVVVFRVIYIKYRKAKTRKGYNARLTVVVGKSETTRSIAESLLSDEAYGYEIIGVFNDAHEDLVTDHGTVEWIGEQSELMNYLAVAHVDELYVPISELDDEQFDKLSRICSKRFIRLKMVPNLNRFTQQHKVGVEFYGNIPVFAFIKTPLEKYANRILKRIFDFSVSLFVIIGVFSWLFPIIALIIKLTSKGPVFFKQQRSGLNNTTFWIYKFRTMQVNLDADTKQAFKGDPRITPFGKFLRKSNMDELPQFINVLKGEMSMVGPRPHMLRHTEMYSALIDEYLERHYILPGITGWAQVHGYRGDTRKLKMMRKRVEFDIWYVENWTFLLDLRIIFLTTIKIFKGDENAI